MAINVDRMFHVAIAITLVVGIIIGVLATQVAPAVVPPAAAIGASEVTTETIANGAVTEAKIADSAVTSRKIAAGGVMNFNIATGAVTSSSIYDGTITADDIADGAVTSVKILDGTITSADILDGTITGADISDGSIGVSDLADNAVQNAKITDNLEVDNLYASGRVYVDNIRPYSTGTSIRTAIDNLVSENIYVSGRIEANTIANVNNLTIVAPGGRIYVDNIRPYSTGTSISTAIDNLVSENIYVSTAGRLYVDNIQPRTVGVNLTYVLVDNLVSENIATENMRITEVLTVGPVATAPTVIKGIYAGKFTYDPPAIDPLDSDNLYTVDLPGVTETVGDILFVSPPGSLENTLVLGGAYVYATNVSVITILNRTAVATPDYAARDNWSYLLIDIT